MSEVSARSFAIFAQKDAQQIQKTRFSSFFLYFFGNVHFMSPTNKFITRINRAFVLILRDGTLFQPSEK